MKIVVIGASNIDITGKSNGKFIFETSNIGKINFQIGGVGKNIADFLARLEEVKLITVIPDSFFGEMIKKDLFYKNIDFTESVMGDFEDSIYLSMENNHGGMISAINQMDNIRHLTSRYLEEKKSYINDSDAVVIDTNLPRETIESIPNIIDDKPFIVEGVSVEKIKKIKNIYGKINLLKVNEDEARVILGDEDKILGKKEMVEKILSLGVEEVHVTLGKDGVVAGNGKEIIDYRVKPIDEVKSVNKAGDAYLAGIISKYLVDGTLEERIQFGTELSRKQIMGGL
ncbi:MAG: PfkB family carbohydrate kinase [Bacillota bacterium]|nr:PfkB family carbohydrate kinase [Bacillota bacterium]